MKTIEIDGKSYLIDIEKALQAGVLTEKDTKPRSCREYDAAMDNGRYGAGEAVMFSIVESVFPTKEEAIAFAALCRLIHLRDAWWGEWKPDWKNGGNKYIITSERGNILASYMFVYNSILVFPTQEMRDDFLSTFRDLIEQAKMFL